MAKQRLSTKPLKLSLPKRALTFQHAWVEKTAGVYAGYLNLTQLVRRTSNKSTKVQLKVTTPKLSADGLFSVIHTGIATVDITLPDTMSVQERKDLSRYIANALDNTIVRDAIENMSPAF